MWAKLTRVNLVLAAAGVGLLGFAAASFNTQTSSSVQTVSAAVLQLEMREAEQSSFAVSWDNSVDRMVPGDVAYRYADLKASSLSIDIGSISAQGSTVNAGVPMTSESDGLSVQMLACSVAWDRNSHTCPGTTTSIIDTTGPLRPAIEGPFSVPVGDPTRLQLKIVFSEDAPNSMQGNKDSIVWRFVASQ